jgi:hypothetical protein
LRDRPEIGAGFVAMTRTANGGQEIGVVRIRIHLSQGEGRAMIEDEEPGNQEGAAIGAALTLSRDDLGLEAPQDRPSLAMR